MRRVEFCGVLNFTFNRRPMATGENLDFGFGFVLPSELVREPLVPPE
jgi:hypothetical protein